MGSITWRTSLRCANAKAGKAPRARASPPNTFQLLSRRGAVLARALCASARHFFLRFDQGNIHQMLADEPGLQFIGAKDLADHEIVGAIVAKLRSAPGEFAALANDDLMRVEKAR